MLAIQGIQHTIKFLCHSDGTKGPLTSLTDVSWKTFEDAAFLRKDSIKKYMEGRWDLAPFGGYCRRCYQMYTIKSYVERVVKKTKLEMSKEEEISEELREHPVTRSCLQSTDIKSCIICQEEKPDSKDRRRRS